MSRMHWARGQAHGAGSVNRGEPASHSPPPIAYSDSPAALRASSRSVKVCNRTSLRFRYWTSQAACGKSSSTSLPRPPCPPRAQRQHPAVAQVPELLRPHLKAGPIPPHFLEPLPHAVVAVVTRSLQERRHGDPLDVRVERLVEVGGPFRERPVERIEALRAVSTFSRDIAYSDSPVASRASALS
jgi:hypothetical protein